LPLDRAREAVESLNLAVAEQRAAIAKAPNVALYRRRLDSALANLAAIAKESTHAK
jgi:hypothetical protein